MDPSVIKVPSIITFGPKRNKGPICNNIWTQAITGSGQHGLGLLGLNTGTAERKRKLVAATHRQNRMEQTSGGENVHSG